MLAGIIRGKFVAMILGAFGMGVSSLLTSAIQPIQQFFSFGLPMAAVSNIANSEEEDEMHKKTIAFRRCLTIMAILACLFTISTSTLLAKWTSGTDSTFLPKDSRISKWFIALGPAVFFMILAAGENAVLQSHRALKQLAKSNMVGPLLGVLLGVPMYYFWGLSGIVPAMIALPCLTWAYTRWNTRNLYSTSVSITWGETISRGRKMMALGGTMMVAGLVGNLAVYLINTFINKTGSTQDVGFYQAATSITMQCTVMVFTALSTDYFPRLTQLSNDKESMNRFINEEGEIVMLITAPLAALLIVLAPVVVRVLLTKEFDDVIPLIQLMSMAFLLKAYYFPLDYICLAKSDKKYFFWMEAIWVNIKMVLVFVGGYKLYGVIGLGYAAVLDNVIDVVVSTVMVKWRYGFVYSFKALGVAAVLLAMSVVVLVSSLLSDGLDNALNVAVVATAVIGFYSLRQLNNRTSLSKYINKRLHHEQ